MNIITNYSHVSIATTNPATDSAARDSAVRPVVPPVAATSASNTDNTNDKEKSQSAAIIPSQNPTYEQPQNDADINNKQASEEDGTQEDTENTNNDSNNESNENSENSHQFSEQELQEIQELKARDAEVVAHELAHVAVGGQYAGSPSYSYETGPDGVKYAVSGEVPIDISKIAGDPQATLQKAQQVKRAALAPAEPSSQDRKVAAQADQMASEARQEILTENSLIKGDEEEDNFKPSNSIESDSFNKRSSLSKDEDFQQTLANRSEHISAFYNQSSQANERSSFQQQI